MKYAVTYIKGEFKVTDYFKSLTAAKRAAKKFNGTIAKL
jgi:hypothetical protein